MFNVDLSSNSRCWVTRLKPLLIKQTNYSFFMLISRLRSNKKSVTVERTFRKVKALAVITVSTICVYKVIIFEYNSHNENYTELFYNYTPPTLSSLPCTFY